MVINVCPASATGWAGSALAREMAATEGIALVAAVSRKQAVERLGDVLGEPRLACPVYATAAEALAKALRRVRRIHEAGRRHAVGD